MQRRKFIKLSSASILPILMGGCLNTSSKKNKYNFEVSIHDDSEVGHILRNMQQFKMSEALKTDVLIVGGGLAGLSAAHTLQKNNKSYLLCELSDRLGGSSAQNEYMNQPFAQGAHYDLAYPSYYGSEVLSLLHEINIINFNNKKDLWEFHDKKFLIPPEIESFSILKNELSSEVLKEDEFSKYFIENLMQFAGKMPMPTRKIKRDLHHLNNITFADYIQKNIKTSDSLLSRINYQMRDDYGGTSNQVSALAGIHYYMCRPYYTDDVELFSPPEGNGYFVHKIAKNINIENTRLNTLVSKIEKGKNKYKVTAIDVPNKSLITIEAEKVIYAGQKHALKYIDPDQKDVFNTNQYAPWMVINFLVKNEIDTNAIWQNEIISEGDDFIGFVDSNAQYHEFPGYRILSAYYCFPQNKRQLLLNVRDKKQEIIEATLNIMSKYYCQPVEPLVEKIYIKVMGHAMPIPVPGYLFNDKNKTRPQKNFVYAGVDNSRLPLLFEAIDSGISAANLV